MKDIIQCDIRNWSEALHFWERTIHWGAGKTCLELGAYKGGLSLWLALKGYSVLCSDVENARVRASPLHEKYGVQNRIRYQDIDATNIPYEDHFDIVVFKSILGGVCGGQSKNSQRKVISEILKALKPGGALLFAENLVATNVHRFFRKRVNWSRTWRYITINEMQEFLEGCSSSELHATGVIGVFGRTEIQRQMLSWIAQVILDQLPDTWKYIVYGVAVK